MWNRIQWLIAIQTAAIGGSYALKSSPNNSAIILGLCTFVTIVLFLMMRRDAAIRDSNKLLLEKMGEDLIAPCNYTNYENREIKFEFSPKLKWHAPLKGRWLNALIFLSFIALDISGIVISLKYPDLLN